MFNYIFLIKIRRKYQLNNKTTI